MIDLSKLKKDDEVWTPASAHMVEKICPKCVIGRMNQTGRVAQSDPRLIIYEHRCSKCQHKEIYTKQYPRVEFTKIEPEGKEN
jgi:hypothetical protein